MHITCNTFAVACYEQNDMSELSDYATREFDAHEAKRWGINESEWREQMKLALDVLNAELLQKMELVK